ncbi:hypothetical protein D3C84_914800 [compost metagenome]
METQTFANRLHTFSIGTEGDIAELLRVAGHESDLILSSPLAAHYQMLACHAGLEPDSLIERATYFQIRDRQAYVLKRTNHLEASISANWGKWRTAQQLHLLGDHQMPGLA